MDAKWSKSMGLDKDLTTVGLGLGVRTERYALVLKDLVVAYVGVSICFKKQYDNAHIL